MRRPRWRELGLLALAVAIALVALTTVNLALRGQSDLAAIAPAIVALGITLVVSLGMGVFGLRGEQSLYPAAIALAGIGLTVVWRVEPDLLLRQSAWIIIGLVAMVVIIAFPRKVDWLKRYKYSWALLGLGLVAITLVAGVDPNGSGARLWLGIGGQYFQPSEILKILLVIFLASYLDDRRELITSGVSKLGPLRLPSIPHLAPLVLMWGLCVLLMVAQKDLGATFLLFGLFLSMIYVASSRFLFVGGGLVAFVVTAFLATRFVSHVQLRVSIWLDPFADAQDTGYQVVQALLAFASGGLFGLGWGFGQPDTIPAAVTDYPLAVIGEQVGLLGTLGVIGLYLLFAIRGLKVASEASNGFQQLLATGLTVTIALQSLIIAAGNLRIIPLTGITLPFVSYGGSSLLANFIILGLLLRISHESRTEPVRSDSSVIQPPAGVRSERDVQPDGDTGINPVSAPALVRGRTA